MAEAQITMQSTGGQVVRLVLLSSLLDRKWERVLMSVVVCGVGGIVSGSGIVVSFPPFF